MRKFDKNEHKNRVSLTILFTVCIFVILLAAVGLSALVVYFLYRSGVLSYTAGKPDLSDILLFMAGISAVIGFGMAAVTIRLPLKPVNELINQMNRLASGDFKARLKANKPFSEFQVFVQLRESFNKMAEELEGTEMLRADFINNFSHEFKTPIVSIAGFAKLLKRENLSDEQKREYIAIIEEESLRLAAMANNVLNLTKVENQTILSDTSEYNLSEQIRSCVLLLESKWTAKKIELGLEFDEHRITANEEMLKQVWINLIDNAIKFSPDYGSVEIDISESDGDIAVSVKNTGSSISPEEQEKIWHKFYQADESHGGEGNGVGLAIVKRIVELHNGKAHVASNGDTTVFTINLPKKS